MGHNIYFGNLPEWVTADDIKSWLESSDLVCDAVRVIRDFETQESKGYAFVEAPNEEEMLAHHPAIQPRADRRQAAPRQVRPPEGRQSAAAEPPSAPTPAPASRGERAIATKTRQRQRRASRHLGRSAAEGALAVHRASGLRAGQASQVSKHKLDLFEIRKPALFGFERGTVYAAPPPVHCRWILHVQHLVIEHVLE